MFAGNNDLQIYKEFFVWVGKPELFKLRKNRMLEYADLAPLAYLHLALDGNIASSGAKHLLIDEMQSNSETLPLPEDYSRRCITICQPLWFVNSRYDSESIHYRRNNETMQKLPLYV